MTQPFENLFWGNTQKHGLNSYEERFRLGGFIIGPDEELMIIRHPLSALSTAYQAEATIASQTGLHIKIEDTRPIIAMKLSKDGSPTGGDYIQFLADGVELSDVDHTGTYNAPSLRVLKENMRDLTETQIKKILEGMKVYRFNYIKLPDVIAVSPEAAEFHELTGWGTGENLNPLTVGSIALRLVQWVWNKVTGMEERLKAVENRLAVTQGSDDAQEV